MVVRAEWVRGGGLSVHARPLVSDTNVGRTVDDLGRMRGTSSERGEVAGWFDDAGEDAEGYGSPVVDRRHIYIYIPERYAVHSVESHFKNLQNQCSRKPNRRSSIVDRMRICIRVFS